MSSNQKRVVVTGAGAISPLGHDWSSIHLRLRECQNAVRHLPEWDVYEGLNTRLAAPALPFELPPHYNRKTTRSMGRVAVMSVRATELALQEAGLLGHPVLRSGMAGVSYGSSSGAHDATAEFGRMLNEFTTAGISATTYLKMMSHTAPVNIGVFFGLTGRVITTSSACTSGSQGVGSGYEAIASGKQTVMLCGGAEQLDATAAAVFDTLFATSVRNDAPETTPRPFDAARDGLVLGEGACTLVLEELEHAQARGPTSSPRSSATVPTATASTSPSPAPTRWPRRCAWPWPMPAWTPRRSATSTPTAPPPTTATSPNRRPPRRCLAAACRSAR